MGFYKIIIFWSALLVAGTLIWWPSLALSQKNFTHKVKKPVENAVKTHKESQKERDSWEEERLRLQSEYEILKNEIEQLQTRKQAIKKQMVYQKSQNKALVFQKQESLNITNELQPFLEKTCQQINTLVNKEVSFLSRERNQRLKRLKTVLDNPEADISEQFSQVMETLLVEAEYGNTVEVYQEKVILNDNEILGHIFRLGRISLFFISMDHQSAASFNVSKSSWETLDNRHIPAIQAAIEMGAKRRPVELLSLPIGKMITQ